MTEDEARKLLNAISRDQEVFNPRLRCINRYGVSLEAFCRIAEDLIKLTPIMEENLTGKHYHIFGIETPQSYHALVKRRATVEPTDAKIVGDTQ